ncbi:MAG: hypothetical protein KC478_17000, partial [Bacteriovoracaceae bacterium]|nr:hypothetical protein [Bacteriovoracaceae bacterium]
MNKIIFLSLLTILTFAQSNAQVDTMQDRPDLKWSEIEDEKFKVVFPDTQHEQAQYILNLLNFYQKPVNESYGADLRKWTVIMRSERSKPNGFVTLTPRRSEWFSHAGITPIISSLEWSQSLAIHEYRHMVQYDYFKRDNLHYGYYLFGELGQAALMAISAPQWYFEGDAVWAETALSNAGRGRSPRFSARMKALMLNNELPTYDELLGGVYTTKLPNHYVYGYFLITRAYNIYGKDVWKEIIAKAAKSPINPYTFYNAFRYVTGKPFIDFYQETVEQLNKEWKGAKLSSNKNYTEYEHPIKNQDGLFYLKKDLDSFWGLYKNGKKLKDLNVTPALSKVDLKRQKFIYPQFLPHYRYGYKDYSDLFMFDVESGSEKRITTNRRLFHPSIHPKKDEIMAVEFKEDFVLSIFNFHGKKLKEVKLKDKIISEAIWYKDQAIAIVLDKQGMKSIGRVDLEKQSFTPMQSANRNNIYNLSINGDRVFFEADDQGVVNIASMDVNTSKLYSCSNEVISALNPSVHNSKLYYVKE